MRVKLALLVILLASLLSACGFGNNTPPTAVSTQTPIPTPVLTATPVTPLAILVMPSDMNKTASDAYQKVVYDLAEQSNMRFQVRNTLTAADIDPGLQIAVILPPDPGIAALAAAAPKVQFLAIDIPGITAGGNVSTLARFGRRCSRRRPIGSCPLATTRRSRSGTPPTARKSSRS